MNDSLRKVIRRLVKNDIAWKLFQPLLKLSGFLEYQREMTQVKASKDPSSTLIESILETSIVRRGPFKGLKYPNFTSFGSSIYPKIVGTYEHEIAEVISQIISEKYSEILDIGCAEGYYAIGLALKSPNSKVYAYDTDEQARNYCGQMAALNDVTDRVEINDFCSSETLAKFPFTKGLIFCDCEGYEKQLFTKENLHNLKNCDLMIETHDFIDLEISGYIEHLFTETHDIKVIRSIDDITKAKTYNQPEGKELNMQQREKLYHEGRPHIMEWYWLRAKQIN